MTFHSHANKTHFHKKAYALGLVLKVRVFGTRKWLIVFNSARVLQFIFPLCTLMTSKTIILRVAGHLAGSSQVDK